MSLEYYTLIILETCILTTMKSLIIEERQVRVNSLNPDQTAAEVHSDLGPVVQSIVS